ncbi:MAG: hypothetical protein R3B53_02895 [Candidatus Paceibacterota bacterium]
MSGLQSRPVEGCQFLDALQLSAGLTYAEEVFREALKLRFGEQAVLRHREIIVPNKKHRPGLEFDADGHMLQADLLEDIARRHWDSLSKKQRDEVYNLGSLAYLARNRDDFEVKTVFFRGMLMLAGDSLDNAPQLIIAKVVARGLSGMWHLADIELWFRQYYYISAYPVPTFRGIRYSACGTMRPETEERDWNPPKFLIA